MREYRVRELYQIAKSGVRVLVVVMSGFLFLAVLYCRLATPMYQADSVIAPATLFSGTNTSTSSALSALTGLSASTHRDDSISRLRAVFSSTTVAADLIAKDHVLSMMQIGNSGSPSFLRRAYQFIFGIRPIDASPQRKNLDAVSKLLSAITFTESDDSPAVTLTFSSPDPEASQKFLSAAVREAQEYLAEQKTAYFSRQISALHAQLDSTSETAVSSALINSILNKQVDMISGEADSFSIIMIKPALIEIMPAWPKPILIIPAALVAGFFLGLLYVFLAAYFRDEFDLNIVPDFARAEQ